MYIAIALLVGVLGYVRIRPALDLRAAAQREKLLASGVNPDALKGWEVLKKGQHFSDATVLSHAGKKRGREMLALQLRGSFSAFTNVNVELTGDDHDRLILAYNNLDPIVSNLREAFQQWDADFWCRMQFLDFEEMVIQGTKSSNSISKAQFKEWSRGYETYVSNMLAMYGGQFLDAGGNGLNPAVQRTMRRNFASALDGGLKSIYKSLEVKLEGESEDQLILHLREMNVRVADDFLNRFREDKTGNIWNGLRALGFSELVLSGDHYHRSVPQNEFVQWCRDYEAYLSELRKVVAQMSDGLSREQTNTGR